MRSRDSLPLRAVLSGLSLLALSLPTGAQTWPMENGSHDVLHSFQNPFEFFFYFHEGVDIRGSVDNVVAVRSGVVRYVDQNNAGGTLGVLIGDLDEFDSYLHVDLGPWNVGDPIQAGDVVGTISDDYFGLAIQDHVHVNRFDGWAGGSGYVTGRVNMLDPLAIFGAAADLDPQMLQAAPHDADLDGVVFRIVTASDNSVELALARGDVDLVLEADDRLTSTLDWNQGLKSVGYWIEAITGGGSDVRDATTPYRLLTFDDAWRGSHPDCDSLVDDALDTTRPVHFGGTNTVWTSLANYKLTNTRGTTGGGDQIFATEFWRTDAKAGTGVEPNGSDADVAQSNAEARFKDGTYLVHALTGDALAEIDTPFPVTVDNFRPYVRRVDVTPVPTGGLSLEIGFSEPMSHAALDSFGPSPGSVPRLRPREGSGGTAWTARIPADEVAADLGSRTTYRLSVRARDLARNPLLRVSDPEAPPVGFSRHDTADGPASGVSTHAFRIRRDAPRTAARRHAR